MVKNPKEDPKINEHTLAEGNTMTIAEGNTMTLDNVVSFKPVEVTPVEVTPVEVTPVEVTPMKFSEAVNAVKMGNKVRRLSWDKDTCIFKRATETYIWKTDIDDMWTPDIEDLEADDWWVVMD